MVDKRNADKFPFHTNSGLEGHERPHITLVVDRRDIKTLFHPNSRSLRYESPHIKLVINQWGMKMTPYHFGGGLEECE